MSSPRRAPRHPVARQRTARGWSQAELARRAGLPRTSVGAVEAAQLTPSVAAALALARVLECSVEELFGGEGRPDGARDPAWAWMPPSQPCRYWEAEVAGRRWLYPVGGGAMTAVAHDGVWQGGALPPDRRDRGADTLVLAACDPAAGLLAAAYERMSGFRLLVFSRGGAAALQLLGQGAVHVAGLHRSTARQPDANAALVREKIGTSCRLLRAARWEAGVALAPAAAVRSLRGLLQARRRWALREPGAAARECLEQLAPGRPLAGRVVSTHAAVAEAVRAGWADAGVCVRLSAVEAGLDFLSVRREDLDLCFPESLAHDPRLQALVRLLRSREHRHRLEELPGYTAQQTGEWMSP